MNNAGSAGSFSSEAYLNMLLLGMSGYKTIVICLLLGLALIIYCSYRIVRGMLRLAEGLAYT